MLCENPVVIQEEETCSDDVPLFLIHDGGGTVFSYFLLGALGRTVHGISNPYFGTNQKWEKGIPDVANYYVELIKETMPSGDILLGGWSLGGLISLEIAHIFSSDPDVNVKGIVMIDSSCPLDRVWQNLDFENFRREFSTQGSIAQKAKTCMQDAFDMIRDWALPSWNNSKPNNTTLPLSRQSRPNGPRPRSQLISQAPASPPTILLRAMQSRFTPSTSSLPSLANEKLSRSETLGWEQYKQLLLRQTFDIPGDHFSLFDEQNVDTLTEKLKLSCDMLVQGKEILPDCAVN